jgi:outer membrane receptor protein involved in Fe transport
LSTGVNAFHQSAFENTQFPAPPQVTFSGGYSGFPIADFLLGEMSAFKQGAGELSRLDGWMFGLFAQDQYRLFPNLTITAGLR